MANESFKPGDTVRLKSGGPLMTVDKVANDTLGALKVWCVWFEKTKQHVGTFAPHLLDADDGVPHIG